MAFCTILLTNALKGRKSSKAEYIVQPRACQGRQLCPLTARGASSPPPALSPEAAMAQDPEPQVAAPCYQVQEDLFQDAEGHSGVSAGTTPG